jgi:phosphoribosylformylglycinamidine synthase
MRLIDLLVAGRTKKIFAAAHDLSKGGLSATLTEMVLRYNTGATIQLEDVGLALLSESPGRVVVAIDPSQTAALIQEAATQKITLTKIGVSGGDALVINDASISLSELRQAHTQTFQKLFG